LSEQEKPVRACDTADLIAQILPGQVAWPEFLGVPAVSAGLSRLPAGATDPQEPHSEDDLCYVVQDRACYRVGTDEREVRSGTVFYVEAGLEHRFHSIQEDLVVPVVFAPAEGSPRPAGVPK
jgi:quercetin dioxygenase-like cupin family protein